MPGVRVVQVPKHEVVGVVAVGDGVVTTARTVDVVVFVGAASVIGRARVGVGGAHRERVVVVVVAVTVVKMAVVQVVDVAVVLDALVAAARAVDMTRVVMVARVVPVVVAVVVIVATVVVVVAAARSVYVSARTRSNRRSGFRPARSHTTPGRAFPATPVKRSLAG